MTRPDDRFCPKACLRAFVDGALSIWHLASSYSIVLLNRIIAFCLEGAAELSESSVLTGP
jgi:hypothetical protein